MKILQLQCIPRLYNSEIEEYVCAKKNTVLKNKPRKGESMTHFPFPSTQKGNR